jgi:hypothetical protein
MRGEIRDKKHKGGGNKEERNDKRGRTLVGEEIKDQKGRHDK